MLVKEDIVAKLIVKPVTKIIGEPTQDDINQMETELTEKAFKIKTTEYIVEQCKKYGFLVVVIGREKYGLVIEK